MDSYPSPPPRPIPGQRTLDLYAAGYREQNGCNDCGRPTTRFLCDFCFVFGEYAEQR